MANSWEVNHTDHDLAFSLFEVQVCWHPAALRHKGGFICVVNRVELNQQFKELYDAKKYTLETTKRWLQEMILEVDTALAVLEQAN